MKVIRRPLVDINGFALTGEYVGDKYETDLMKTPHFLKTKKAFDSKPVVDGKKYVEGFGWVTA